MKAEGSLFSGEDRKREGPERTCRLRWHLPQRSCGAPRLIGRGGSEPGWPPTDSCDGSVPADPRAFDEITAGGREMDGG